MSQHNRDFSNRASYSPQTENRKKPQGSHAIKKTPRIFAIFQAISKLGQLTSKAMPHLPPQRMRFLLMPIAILIIWMVVTNISHDADAKVTLHEEWLAAETDTATPSSQQSITLKTGDNAVRALMHLGFDRANCHAIVQAAKKTYQLKNIRAGHRFTRLNTQKGRELLYNIDAHQRLHLQQLSDGSWQASLEKRITYSRRHITSARIQGSLFLSAARAGLDQRTIMNLVDIFAWDIDFARDIRSGDSFSLIYEEIFDDEGNHLSNQILAAQFVNQGKSYRAVRYEQRNGDVHYFTPDGKSMRKAYLKAPVKFSRISSRFTLRRKHPVLGYTRAHKGVDYAAPRGTPVHAIGDGVVVFKGWRGGYGRFIQIRHNNRNHSTAYAHLSRYAKGIKRGKRVHQGQVIGYVGMSGLATGPHLHFEFRVRGRAVNPLTVKHPPATPIKRTEKQRFLHQTAPLITQLQHPPVQQKWS